MVQLTDQHFEQAIKRSLLKCIVNRPKNEHVILETMADPGPSKELEMMTQAR
jgi:hypothetical protein